MALGPLQVGLEAKLDKYNASMDDAFNVAKHATEKIEKVFSDANPTISTGNLLGVLAGFAGGAAIVKLVDLLVSANSEMAKLADNAERVGLTTERFQQLRFAGNLGGVSNEGFASGIEGMAKLLNDARRDENEFTKLLDKNNQKWKDRQGNVIGVNQALLITSELVRNAGTELDKIKIAEIAGLSRDWVKALENGPGAFNAMAEGANAAGAVISKETIEKAKEFDRQWSQATVATKAYLYTLFAEAIGSADDLINRASKFVEKFKELENARRGGGPMLTFEIIPGSYADKAIDVFKEIGKEIQQLTGSTAVKSIADQLRDATKAAGEFGAALARIAEANDTGQLGAGVPQTGEAVPFPRARPKGPETQFADKGGKESEGRKNAIDREIDSINRHIAVVGADAKAVGLSAGEHAKLRTEAQLYEAAARANINVNSDLANKFAEMGDKAAQAASNLEQARNRFAAVNDTVRLGGNILIDAFDKLTSKSATLKEVAADALKTLSAALIKAAVLGEGPLAALLGTKSSGGGVGGLLGALVKGFSGSSGSLDLGDVPADLLFDGGRASGGPVSAGSSYLVGERGPELFRPSSPGTIVPNDVLRAQQGGTVSMPLTISVDARGAQQGASAEIVGALRRELPGMILATVQDARKRRAL